MDGWMDDGWVGGWLDGYTDRLHTGTLWPRSHVPVVDRPVGSDYSRTK